MIASDLASVAMHVVLLVVAVPETFAVGPGIADVSFCDCELSHNLGAVHLRMKRNGTEERL